jgi:hypothetical protein
MNDTPVPVATFVAHDQDEIDRYAHATSYSLILWDIETKLRNDYKWGDFPNMTVIDYIEKLREQIASWKSEYHLPE